MRACPELLDLGVGDLEALLLGGDHHPAGRLFIDERAAQEERGGVGVVVVDHDAGRQRRLVEVADVMNQGRGDTVGVGLDDPAVDAVVHVVRVAEEDEALPQSRLEEGSSASTLTGRSTSVDDLQS